MSIPIITCPHLVSMMAKMHAVSHQWVASLANYNVWLHYRVGKTNINADALSRVS